MAGRQLIEALREGEELALDGITCSAHCQHRSYIMEWKAAVAIERLANAAELA
jgi:hypothetical protein